MTAPEEAGREEILYMEDPRASDLSKVEHQLRYHVAKLFAQGKDVLDIGFGCGYGSEMLAKVASNIIGIDKNGEAVEHAKKKHVKPNLGFFERDALRLSESFGKEDDWFDLAVAFEVMEHLPDPQRFLKEVKAILKPRGMLILSVPYYHQTGPQEQVPGVNPHHLWTWEREGLEKLLKSVFPNVTVMIQYSTGFFFTYPAGTSWIAFCQKE